MAKGRPKNPDRLNVTIRLTKEEIDYLTTLATTEYGTLSYSDIVHTIIKKHMEK